MSFQEVSLSLAPVCVIITINMLIMWTTGGWSMHMKDLKLQQVIGKGEFGGE